VFGSVTVVFPDDDDDVLKEMGSPTGELVLLRVHGLVGA
jgi:hypothetical protein